MTIRSFWNIFLKILGFWLITEMFSTGYSFLTAISFMFDAYDGGSRIMSLIFTLIIMMIYLLGLYLFFFRTNWLIDVLKLDKGFTEDRLDLNGYLFPVLHIAVIVTGGLLLADALPKLCRELFEFFQVTTIFRESKSSGFLIMMLVKALIGYLLMTNSQFIVSFIRKRSQDE